MTGAFPSIIGDNVRMNLGDGIDDQDGAATLAVNLTGGLAEATLRKMPNSAPDFYGHDYRRLDWSDCHKGDTCLQYAVKAHDGQAFKAVAAWNGGYGSSPDCFLCANICDENAPRADLDLRLRSLQTGQVVAQSMSYDNSFEIIDTVVPAGNYYLEVRRFGRTQTCGTGTYFAIAWTAHP